MSWARKIKSLIRSIVREELVRVRTWDIGQVVEYVEGRAKIRLCVRGIRTEDPENMTTVNLPILEDVPVFQYGAGKLVSTCCPAVNSYGIVLYAHRDIEAWLTAGGVVDPKSTRRWDLSDAVFIPGLYPYVVDGDNGQLEEAPATDRISIRTRTGKTEISVIDDESIEINVNDGKAAVVVDLDGNVSVTSQGDASVYVDGDIDIEAAGNVSTDAAETALQAGTDYAIQYTALKSAFDTLKTDLNNLITAYNAHIHITTATVGVGPVGVIAPTTSTGTPSAADMSSSKVDDVRLP